MITLKAYILVETKKTSTAASVFKILLKWDLHSLKRPFNLNVFSKIFDFRALVNYL